MTAPVDIGARRVRTDLHTSENFYLLSTNNSPRTLSPPNSLRRISPRRFSNTSYNYNNNNSNSNSSNNNNYNNNNINNYQNYQQQQRNYYGTRFQQYQKQQQQHQNHHQQQQHQQNFHHQNQHQYIYSSSCPPAPSPLSSHLPARATRLLNRSRLQQQTHLGSTAGSDSPKSNDSFNLNRKNTSSSRTSSLHLSNREINSSSDDLLLYDKSFRNSMIQDVLYFKKQLLRLRRILQETDTLNPFEVNNGQFFASPVHGTTGAATTTTAQSAITNNQQQQHQSTKNNHGGSGNSISSNQSDLLAQQYFVGSSGGSDNEKHFGNSLQSLTSLDDPIQELADLRRQSQVDDRERTIRFQKNLIEKLENESEKSRESFANPSLNASALEKEVVNTATQTERVRPLSIGQEGLSRLQFDQNYEK